MKNKIKIRTTRIEKKPSTVSTPMEEFRKTLRLKRCRGKSPQSGRIEPEDRERLKEVKTIDSRRCELREELMRLMEKEEKIITISTFEKVVIIRATHFYDRRYLTSMIEREVEDVKINPIKGDFLLIYSEKHSPKELGERIKNLMKDEFTSFLNA